MHPHIHPSYTLERPQLGPPHLQRMLDDTDTGRPTTAPRQPRTVQPLRPNDRSHHQRPRTPITLDLETDDG